LSPWKSLIAAGVAPVPMNGLISSSTKIGRLELTWNLDWDHAFYSLPYDVLNGFVPISPLATGPTVLVGRKTSAGAPEDAAAAHRIRRRACLHRRPDRAAGRRVQHGI
jgi:hypothetical protein